MSVTLFYDVATTRFATDRKTNEAPVVIRLAWLRSDEPSPHCLLVEPPEGVTMDERALAYHGITLDEARAIGKRCDHVAALFADAATMIDQAVAFNAAFHQRNIARLPSGSDPDDRLCVETLCAMDAALPIMKLPATHPNHPAGFKSPSLTEACSFFGLPLPLAPGDTGGSDPIERGKSVVRAVRGVWEAIQARVAA